MTPIVVEIVAPMLSSLGFGCRGCGLVTNRLGLQEKLHHSSCEEYPEHWKESGARIADWIQEIDRLYKHRIRITLIDAQSPLGLWKQIRHGVFKLPAFIVDKTRTCAGWDADTLQSLIDERLRELSDTGGSRNGS
ncbi:MAG: hypothetical protein RDU20_02150 [Desulfomonilaceae bacterium]|nr:hypothetical protein [Desulfomonilaceae bacterium]